MLASGLAASLLLAPMTSFKNRVEDWRYGAIVYQVFVDRFVPAPNLKEKLSLYKHPQQLRNWEELPKPTPYDPILKTYPHVLEFWGGDLPSLRSKLGYIKDLGTDVLYLNPIFKSPSNHKYDTEDYFAIDPQYGSSKDYQALIKDVHRSKMRLMLDGVFNHIGATSPIFQAAKQDPKSPYRDWFFFGPEYAEGYRGWSGVASLPALKLETKAVRDYLWSAKGSVVQKFLKEGLDGWRLDVAFELGPNLLANLTKAAHKAKKDSIVIGEISGYPAEWSGAVDGVFNFTPINLGIAMLEGKVTGGKMGEMLDDMVADAGIEQLLRSWLLTDNHDTDRFASVVKDPETRNLVRTLQFTLPGSPCLYYGSELGMEGIGDPGCRAPMRWNLVTDANPDLISTKTLIALRKAHPALRYGDCKALRSDRLLAFIRTTDQVKQAVLVVMNPTHQTVKETFTSRLGRVLSWGELQDIQTGQRIRSITGLIDIEVPARTVRIFAPVVTPSGGYSPYDRLNGQL
jgi:glycosidase